MPLASEKPTRREVFEGLGAVGLAVAAGSVLSNGAFAEETFTPTGLQRDLPDDALDRQRALFKQRGDFDLSNPAELARARMKSIFSLDGTKSYVLRVSRSLICPPGVEAQTLLTELQLWYSVFELVSTDEQSGEPTQVINHSLFTRMAVDPETMQRLPEVKIVETGQTLDVPDTLFAASITTDLVTGREARMGGDGNTAAGPTSGYTTLGPDLVFLAKGGRTNEGPHQPQVDMSSWAAPMNEVQDPSLGSASARYSFSGISKASIYSWAGPYGGPEETQVINHKIGVKSPTFDGLPDYIKTLMQDRYPDRI